MLPLHSKFDSAAMVGIAASNLSKVWGVHLAEECFFFRSRICFLSNISLVRFLFPKSKTTDHLQTTN